jgi:hypothetical protein
MNVADKNCLVSFWHDFSPFLAESYADNSGIPTNTCQIANDTQNCPVILAVSPSFVEIKSSVRTAIPLITYSKIKVGHPGWSPLDDGFSLGIFYSSKMRFGSEVIAWNSNMDLLGEKLKTSKRVIGTPMEVSWQPHLLILRLRRLKVRLWVCLTLGGNQQFKNTLSLFSSQGKVFH